MVRPQRRIPPPSRQRPSGDGLPGPLVSLFLLTFAAAFRESALGPLAARFFPLFARRSLGLAFLTSPLLEAVQTIFLPGNFSLPFFFRTNIARDIAGLSFLRLSSPLSSTKRIRSRQSRVRFFPAPSILFSQASLTLFLYPTAGSWGKFPPADRARLDSGRVSRKGDPCRPSSLHLPWPACKPQRLSPRDRLACLFFHRARDELSSPLFPSSSVLFLGSPLSRLPAFFVSRC